MHFIERSNERGRSELGWLHSRFTYSFAEYYNQKRMGFGALRVVNDDIVEPKNGFPLHHHEQMEIVTIMLAGVLTHGDSMGNKKELRAGEVQVMTAGTGVDHSEWNHDENVAAKLLQIWVYPKERALTPRYDQKKFAIERNILTTLVSGVKKDGALFIHQDAIFARGIIEGGKQIEYKLANPKHGIFLFVISGKVVVGEDVLSERDAIEITDEEHLVIKAKEDGDVLLIEVPLSIS